MKELRLKSIINYHRHKGTQDSAPGCPSPKLISLVMALLPLGLDTNK
jgi:hypothetical protein